MIIVEKFEQILLDFFKTHHPRKVNKVPGIVEEFKGNEVALLKALCEKYKKDYAVIPELKEAIDSGNIPSPAPALEETAEEPAESEAPEVIAQIEEPTESTEESDELDELDDVVESTEEEEKKED